MLKGRSVKCAYNSIILVVVAVACSLAGCTGNNGTLSTHVSGNQNALTHLLYVYLHMCSTMDVEASTATYIG